MTTVGVVTVSPSPAEIEYYKSRQVRYLMGSSEHCFQKGANLAEYSRNQLAVFDLPAVEKIGDSCVDLGLLGKHCVPQWKTGTKRHTLTLVISGPDEDQAEQRALECLQGSVVQAALSSVALAFTPVGLPAVSGFVALAATAFVTCLGDKKDGVSADFQFSEHWL